MCGIAGIVSFTTQVVQQNMLQKMALFMQQRGPDFTGYWIDDKIGFVHTRLAIIDLNENANQPMHSGSGNTSITFNGEIYNYLQLKEKLIHVGCTFKTYSDTEVILHGYEMWGIEKLVNMLDGMFAFVLFDKKSNRTYLVRDRFGKKPLYYHFSSNSVTFSSDIRAIYAVVERQEINYAALDYFFSELSVPQPNSIWQNIQQVYKSSYLTVNNTSGQVHQHSYWQIQPSKLNISYDEAEKEVEKALVNAILKRTIADVSIGCFLSGGIDSGLVTALLAQNQGKPVKTFTVGFQEQDFSELADAKSLALRYGTDHTEIVINPNIEEAIHNLVYYYGEPFADSSALPTYFVCREMRKHVTVALSGDGGDELFGYLNYGYMAKVQQFSKQYPSALMREAVTAYSKLASRFNKSKLNYGALNNEYKQLDTGKALNRNMAFTDADKENLYQPWLLQKSNHFAKKELKNIWAKYANFEIEDRIFAASLDTRLLNDYLVKVDRSSMINSLEVRSPFLDMELAKLAFSLPNQYKIKDGEVKYVLKKLAQKHIDPAIFNRKKIGFGIPVKHWINNELQPLIREHLSKEAIAKRGFFKGDYIQHILQEHKQKSNQTHKIWGLLWFELWCKRFLD